MVMKIAVVLMRMLMMRMCPYDCGHVSLISNVYGLNAYVASPMPYVLCVW